MSPDADKGAARPTPTVAPGAATPGHPAGTAAPQADWLRPGPRATPEPDPAVRTPSSSTPLGTAEPGASSAEEQARAAAAKAQALAEKARAFADTPEGKVVVAFAGGVLASFVLKRFGR